MFVKEIQNGEKENNYSRSQVTRQTISLKRNTENEHRII